MSEGTKYDQNKVRMELLPNLGLVEVGKVFTFGAEKYGDHNWRAGIKWTRLLGAAIRHTTAFLLGQDKDPESGYSHLAHAVACLLMIIEFKFTKPEFDDRYKPVMKTPSSLNCSHLSPPKPITSIASVIKLHKSCGHVDHVPSCLGCQGSTNQK